MSGRGSPRGSSRARGSGGHTEPALPTREGAKRSAGKQQRGSGPCAGMSQPRGSVAPSCGVAVIAFNCRAVISGRRFTLEGECGESQEQLGMGPRIFLWLFLEYRHMAGGGLWRYP